MIRAVYDCNVIMSGIGWNGAARNCLKLVACRQVFLYVTDEILAEYAAVIPEILAEETPKIDPLPKLAWIRNKARLVEPAPLVKQRRRDAKDDPYLACALAAGVKVIVSRDDDLLTMNKPFGIQIVTPRERLTKLTRTI